MCFKLYIGDVGSGSSGKSKKNIGGTPFKIQIDGDGSKLFTTINQNGTAHYAEIIDMLKDAERLN